LTLIPPGGFPDLATPTLVAAIVAFMLGWPVVSVADELEDPAPTGHAPRAGLAHHG
jgi:hypothetical protein